MTNETVPTTPPPSADVTDQFEAIEEARRAVDRAPSVNDGLCPPCRFCGSDEALDTLDGDLKWVHLSCYEAAGLAEMGDDDAIA